jgi:L-serine dehydratase
LNRSVFEVFRIGVGPSSSHTMGPMLAARMFVVALEAKGALAATAEVFAQLYGSLALTGRGHCTDRAILLGLEGHDPTGIDPAIMEPALARIRATHRLRLLDRHEVPFDEPMNLLFHRDQMLPGHSNGMRFTARAAGGKTLHAEEMYSIGGGAVQRAGESAAAGGGSGPALPLPFEDAAELLVRCRESGLSIDQVTMRNESALRPAAETEAQLDRIWSVMQACVRRGFAAEGVLPGVLRVPRRAAALKRSLEADDSPGHADPLEWVNAWALAVNEENAAGGQVVTAPTNGAAGIVPAVLHYYVNLRGGDAAGVRRFLLTAGAIGLLYKKNASISGAEMGCQGEVGVACSMAAAGLAAAFNGSADQVENAAEIGMEHNLGLTCDPVAGLVQIPCIERNAMGAVKAINAARLALRGDGTHIVSLDQVIATMHQTGLDMSTHYKETSKGGLAVNVPEC